jgi:hypothetical protein
MRYELDIVRNHRTSGYSASLREVESGENLYVGSSASLPGLLEDLSELIEGNEIQREARLEREAQELADVASRLCSALDNVELALFDLPQSAIAGELLCLVKGARDDVAAYRDAVSNVGALQHEREAWDREWPEDLK